MKIKKMRIENFQSFEDSSDIIFKNGFNLIIGQNNVGKSAILRALQPDLKNDPHRTATRWEAYRMPPVRVEMVIEASGLEVKEQIQRDLNEGTVRIHTQVPSRDTSETRSYLEEYFKEEAVFFDISHVPDKSYISNDPNQPSHILFGQRYGSEPNYAQISFRGDDVYVDGYVPQARGDSFPAVAQRLWQRKMFYFAAERLVIGQAAQIHTDRLSNNADNLPAVLDTLQGGRGDIFAKLIEHVREVLPTVGNISVLPMRGNPGNIEILVWPTSAMTNPGLSFSLNSSGTGVAQVVAILTAVMTTSSSTIIIDEINSFLHPAAVKSLLRILQTYYSEHQYIVSTHAPEVISFSNPQTVHLVTKKDYSSSVKSLNIGDLEELRNVATLLGVSMSDVFAAEKVIWVEGPTEEICFAFLYELHTGESLPKGLVFLSVVSTGDFSSKKRDRKMIFEVYKRLTSAAAPLVQYGGFSFDRETLTVSDMKKLTLESDGSMHFLPRRHLECYAIDADAILSFINGRLNDPGVKITRQQVVDEMIKHASSDNFKIPEWKGDLDDEDWQSKVDGAKLITAAISGVSEARVAFFKKSDTLELIKHIASHPSGRLRDLAKYVYELIPNRWHSV